MSEIKVLIEGYAREENGAEHASCSTTLIQSNGINIVVDPGINREMLLVALNRENLKPEDINYVFLTHNHMDHMLLTGIFVNADILDNEAIYSWDGKIASYDGVIPGTDIKVIQTPGHDQFHSSLLVDTGEGIVAAAGDIFWWPDGGEPALDKDSLMNLKDPYVKNEEQLKKSREEILGIADYVIPGHGKMFKVEK
jgi:glyoxylase-like metal-dependent hydrolase (beta-lactamase superfamily II)